MKTAHCDYNVYAYENGIVCLHHQLDENNTFTDKTLIYQAD
jgi:hypothetical protein